MKYIDEAMERLRNKDPTNPHSELSLVERILANEPDPKMAYILALDLILVGIDTVSPIITSLSCTIEEERDNMHFLLHLPAARDAVVCARRLINIIKK